MATSSVIGIDVGTTAVKAAVVASDGDIRAMHSGTYPLLRRAGGIAEQDPDDWLRIVTDALAKFDAEGYLQQVEGIGLCSQVNTHVFLDENGQPVMPAILWQDGRASVEAAELDAQVSEEQKLAWWGSPMPIDASHALPRMLWVSRHHPELWEKTRYVMLPKDYCVFKLTGNATTDPLSNIGLTDNNLHYIDALFDFVPRSREKMAKMSGLTDIIGHISSNFPGAGKPLVNGTMDAWAGLVGAGGAKQGSVVYLSGTSEILGISSKQVHPTPGAIVFPEFSGVRLHAAPTQNGGDAKKWFADAFELSLDDMSKQVANSARRPQTPMFLPQLEGERAPLWEADLRAAFLGVTRQSSKTDFARAVYEGVSMAALWALETLESSSGVARSSIHCSGNGFKSDAWGQIRADVIGAELKRMAVSESGILGAAMIAMVATGIFNNLDEASSTIVRFDRVFTPNHQNTAQYGELFDLYKSAIAANREINSKIAQTSAKFG